VPGNFSLEGEEPGVSLASGGVFKLALVFIVENNVSLINLYRAGSDSVLPYNLGFSRPYSVYVATNDRDLEKLKQMEECIATSGCKVLASTRLKGDIRGIIIHFAPKVESVAREISQRLMTKFNVMPVLQESQLISEFDIVIWVSNGIIRGSSL